MNNPRELSPDERFARVDLAWQLLCAASSPPWGGPMRDLDKARELSPHERDLALVERYLALAGYAFVSIETAQRWEQIERELAIGCVVSESRIEEVIDAVYSGPYGDYHVRKVFA